MFKGALANLYQHLKAGQYTLLIALSVFIAGCTPQPVKTGLFDTSQHTGTVWTYRVGGLDYGSGGTFEPRFSQLQSKDDSYRSATEKTIVTSDDLISVTLDYTFVKYFKEADVFTVDNDEFETEVNDRKGEIAFVISFDAGTTKQESMVVFSSKGQTLGSPLSFSDWPVIGPLKVDGNVLSIRVVMIEMDNEENEQIKQATRALAGIASVAKPGLTAATKIALPVADAIIALNSDDVILDQKFALQRINNKADIRKRSTTGPSPLLYGQYVLILQEDVLRGDDVAEVASVSTEAPALSSMRFDHYSDRLYMAYPYWADGWGWAEYSTSKDFSKEKEVEVPDEDKTINIAVIIDQAKGVAKNVAITEVNKEVDRLVDEGLIAKAEKKDKPNELRKPKTNDLHEMLTLDDGKCLNAKSENVVDEVHFETGKLIRKQVLGYDDTDVTELDNWYCMQDALYAAFCDAERGKTKPPLIGKSSRSDDGIFEPELDCEIEEDANFSYPVTVYPDASVVMAQYPKHTHIVLSVSRSLESKGNAAHENFQSFDDFVKEQIQSARDNSLSRQLSQQLISAYMDDKKMKTTLKKVASNDKDAEKLCLLYKDIKAESEGGVGDESAPVFINKSPLYNEIYHITGEYMTDESEVLEYIKGNKSGLEKECTEQSPCKCFSKMSIQE